MHIVLTHEQADFDALASLLGAHLLEVGSLPVLPRRINRNVEGYINLHGHGFPYIDPRDLPKGKIDRVTLVDTQSLITIKGLQKKAKINIIDHHPQKDNLPKDWSLQINNTGATITLIVEALREREVPLTAVVATLMLLGIYEDTGGLIYANTSARDLSAAAYLLERGGDLSVVG
ncbi:MAG: DHH family phosphoesterase, partial [Chloroflexota bacterium]